MADEQVIKLLEEIRDLQKEHAENYKAALQNQQARLQQIDENAKAAAQNDELKRQKLREEWAATRRRQKWLIITAVIALISAYTFPFLSGIVGRIVGSWPRK